MSKRFLAFLSIGCLSLVVTLSAENWPAWRGPLANGVSGEKGLPTKWSTKENIAWKLAMPSRSGATPIVWNDHIFLNVATAMTSGDLELWAVDRKKGEPLWKRPLGGGNNQQRKQNMSSPSPVTDGSTVWVMTGTGILKAFDFKGTELWMRDVQKDYGRFGLDLGLRLVAPSASGLAVHPGPARDDDRRSVVCHEESTARAARRSGRWTVPRRRSRSRLTRTRHPCSWVLARTSRL